jgi:hypothetical protein
LFLYISPKLTKWVIKVKPDINITTVDARGIINEHPMDGALVSAGSLWQLRSKEGVALVYLASLYF